MIDIFWNMFVAGFLRWTKVEPSFLCVKSRTNSLLIGKCTPFKGNYALWLQSRQARVAAEAKKEAAFQRRLSVCIPSLNTIHPSI